MSEVIASFIKEMAGRSPVLLVYLAGIVLALVFWRRSPAASILVILGAGTMLLSTLVWSFVFQYVMHSYMDWGWTFETLSDMLQALGLLSNLIHAAGMAMVLAAAFVGRGRQAERSQVYPQEPPPWSDAFREL